MITVLFSLLPIVAPVSIEPVVAPVWTAPLLQAGSASAQGVARVYDLSHIDWNPVQERDMLATSLVPGLELPEAWTENGAEDQGGSTGARIVALIQTIIGDEFQYEGRRFEETRSGQLLVVAPASLHQRISSLLTYLERMASSSVELSVDVVTLPAGQELPTIGPIVPVAQADRWMAGIAAQRGSSASYEMHVSASSVAVLKSTRDVHAVLDYDVEIAQGATIGDPITRRIPVGKRLALRAAPSASGVHLAMTWKHSEILDAPARELQAGFMITMAQGKPGFFENGLHVTDLRVMSRSVSLATHLPRGHAMILEMGASLERAGMREYLVLRQSGSGMQVSETLGLGDSGQELLFAHLGALVPPSCAHGGALMWPTIVHDVLERGIWDSPSLSAGLRRPETSTYASFIEGASGNALVVDVQGDWLLAYPSDVGTDVSGDLARVRNLFDELLAPTETLNVRIQLDQAGQAAVVAQLPVRLGTSAGVAIGIEDFEQPDYDVEVAQFSATQDPVINAAFDGLVLFLDPTVTSSGALSLTLRGAGHLLLEREQVDLGSYIAARLDHSEYAHLFVNETLTLHPDADGTWSAAIGLQGEGAARTDLTLRVDISR
ncbi:MAG: hypothetical protein ACI8QZ_000618 [Chlamydiales bacterium]|jgi:hypothetical protein